VWLAIGWLGCNGPDEPLPPPSVATGGPEIPVEVEVDGELVFEGVANAPENGLYQPPAEGVVCAASRRVGVFKGSDLYLEVLFPDEIPSVGSEVLFPSSVDEAAGDWNAAGWRGEGDVLWAAYGGVATLDAWGEDVVQIAIADATVCGSDWLGTLVDPDGLWRDHTTDCVSGASVVFRTMDVMPFDPNFQTWCSAGRPGSWQTPEGVPLCSVDRLPCDPELR
jgi:hypothetical protein